MIAFYYSSLQNNFFDSRDFNLATPILLSNSCLKICDDFNFVFQENPNLKTKVRIQHN